MKSLHQLAAPVFLFLLVFSNSAFSHAPSTDRAFNKAWKMKASLFVEAYRPAIAKLSKMDIDIAGVDVKRNIVDVLITDEEYQRLSESFEIEVMEVKGVTRGPDEEYQNPAEIEKRLQEFAALYPSLTKLVSIGKSLEGRDIWALKISDNVQTKELEEPALLFNSMHHAREVMTPEISLDIVQYLLENYEQDLEATGWVNNNEVWVIPMFNVDGNNKMWNEDSWWRKNTRGGYGVDLNRNYPTGWDACNGSSGWRHSQTYRGDAPASEPETQAMMSFVSKIRPVFDISYHSYSELVIYPYGCEPKRTQTKEVVEGIGKKIAGLINYTPGTAWETLYNADGGDIDWMYETYQVIPYVIEVNSRSAGFHPDYDKWRDKTVERNRPAWQFLLNRVQQSGIRGVVSVDGKALAEYDLEVFKIENGKTNFFQSYKGHTSGIYHLVLNPGEYELRLNSRLSEKSWRVKVEENLVSHDIKL